MVGIRVDEGLYSVFKPVAQRVFGSVCRPIEAFMASVIAVSNMGANFGNTIEVGRVVIERNLRPRRKLELVDSNVFEDGLDSCLYCGQSSVTRLRFLRTGKVYGLCRFHAENLLDSGNWEVVE